MKNQINELQHLLHEVQIEIDALEEWLRLNDRPSCDIVAIREQRRRLNDKLEQKRQTLGLLNDMIKANL